MNLPELLGTGNSLVSRAPKTAEASVPEDTGGQSFMDTLNDASSEAETIDAKPSDAKHNQTKSEDDSESSDEAQVSAVTVDAQSIKAEHSERAGIEIVQAEKAKSTGFSMASAVLERQVPASNSSENSLDKTGPLIRPSALAQAGTPLPAMPLTAGVELGDDGRPEKTGESLQGTPSGENTSKTDPISALQKPLPNTAQSSFNTQLQAEAPGADLTQTKPNPPAMPVDVKFSGAPANAKVQAVDPSGNKPVDVPRDADTAKSDLKMMDMKLAKEAHNDQRQSERRGESASYDLKTQERLVNQAQSSANSTTSTPRFAFGQSLVSDVAQPGTTGQSTSIVAQSEASRDVSTARGATQTTGQSFETQGAARSAAAQIAAALKSQPMMKTIELSLDPPELGRIEIHMEMAEMGLRATLSAERSGTGDLIRRQADLLLQQLDDAGFSDVDLDFRDFGGGEGQESQNDSQSAPGTSGLISDSAVTPPKINAARNMSVSGMDVRL